MPRMVTRRNRAGVTTDAPVARRHDTAQAMAGLGTPTPGLVRVRVVVRERLRRAAEQDEGGVEHRRALAQLGPRRQRCAAPAITIRA